MQQLIMNSKAIHTHGDFCRYFSAEDVLYNKELVAGFLRNKVRHLSIIDGYHTEIFFQMVFLGDKRLLLYQFRRPSDYEKAEFACKEHKETGVKLLSKRKRDYLRYELERTKVRELATKVWNVVQDTSLAENDKQILFCLLTSAYAISGKDPDENGYSVTAQQAENAYLKKRFDDDTDTAVSLTEKENVVFLKAREEPYVIILKSAEAKKLVEGEKAQIRYKKIVAAPHGQGAANIPVTLHIYKENTEGEKETVSFMPGDYRYINIVENLPVYVHPVRSESNLCSVERKIDTILFSDFISEKTETIAFGDSEMISFAAEERDIGFLAVTEKGIEDYWYTQRNIGYLCHSSAVEVAFHKGYYVYLDPEGKIHTNSSKKTEKRYVTIGDYFEEQKNEK